jgi:hypothetical protein
MSFAAVRKVRPEISPQAELRLPPQAKTQDHLRHHRSVHERGAGHLPGRQRPFRARRGQAQLVSRNKLLKRDII